jgi:hypothetical protein
MKLRFRVSASHRSNGEKRGFWVLAGRKAVEFRHADNASPPEALPTLALRTEKSPTDKGQAF